MRMAGDLALRKERGWRELTLYDKLVLRIAHGIRGKRLYTPCLIEFIAQVSCPDAGGTRGPIAIILSHMRNLRCMEKVELLKSVFCVVFIANFLFRTRS